MLPGFVRAKEIIAWLFGRRQRMHVLGHSMEPLVHDKQDILIKPYSPKHIPRVDDIVIAQSPREDRILLKRVIKIKHDHCWLEGLHVASTDSRSFGWISLQAVQGQLTLVLR